MEWNIDLTEMNGLRKWYRNQPRLVQRGSAQLLNDFAFGVRKQAIQHIGRVMIVRAQAFVASRLRVTKTSGATPIGSQRSITGSIASERFSGWTEQEKGTPTSRHRFATLAGRGGDKHKKIRPGVRLKPSNEVITIADAKPVGGRGNGPGTTNYGGFVAMMLREKENRLIRMKGSIYKRKRNKLEHVQTLRAKQPKPLRWLRQSRAIYFKTHNPQDMWNRIAGSLIKPPPKR